MAVFSPSAAAISNPYKFSVYRTAALNSPSATQAVVAYDTKLFDTGTNVDVVTNKGRFTAPVAGFYYFSARMSIATSTRIILFLYKNSAEAIRGNDLPSGTPVGGVVSGMLQLAAGDFVEVEVFTGTTVAYEIGSNNAYFHGFLVSVI